MYNSTNKNVLSSTGIAILASLGIHGLLWAVLPGLTVSQADKSPSQRTIGLVDLSPQEQSRLPQVLNPVDNTLPAFASQLTALPPAPPSPPYQTLPPIQTSVAPPLQLSPGSSIPLNNNNPSQNSAPPSVQIFQGTVPPPPTTSFQPNPSQNVPSSSNYYPNPSAPQTGFFVTPSNNGLPNVPLTPDRTIPADDDIATATPSPEPSQPTSVSPNTPAPEANRLPQRGKDELMAMRESMRNNFPSRNATSPVNNRSMSRQEIATALKATRNNQTTPASPSMSRQEIATALKATRNNKTTPASPSMSRQEIANALRRQTRNPSNELSQETKTALETLDNFKRQQAAVQAQNPDVVTSSPIRRKLTACDRKLKDLAIISVVVNPEGKRLSEPVLISKPRKANLTKAQNYVRNYQFTKTGKTTNYNFRLEFNYSDSKCAQAQPTPSTPKLTPSPTLDTPEPTPTPTPNIPRPTSTLTPSSPEPTPASTPAPSPSPEVTATPQPIDPQKPSF